QKYIVTLSAPPGVEPREDHLEQEELYDLLADPDERRNLLEDSGVDVEPFRRELANYLREARTMRASRKSETIVEDDTTLERLRTLGYIN
ncbi:MAG: hypothetical protein ACRD1X_20950, partial [Vicinamibacteria bacterium]